jgi:hypothetical protein
MKTKLILIGVIFAILTGTYLKIRSNYKKAIRLQETVISDLRKDLLQVYKTKSKTDTVFIKETDTTYITESIIFRDTIEKLIYEKAPVNTYRGNNKGSNYSFDYRVVTKGWMTSLEFKNIFIKKEIEKTIVEMPFEVIKIKEVYTPKRHLYLSGGYYSDLNFNSWVAGLDYFGKKRLGFGAKYFFNSKGILAEIKIRLF